MDEWAEFRRTIDKTTAAFERLHDALMVAFVPLCDADYDRDMVAYFCHLPAYRRAKRDYDNGYRSPRWVHDVWDAQAAQFGTGNGRTVREGWAEGSEE